MEVYGLTGGIGSGKSTVAAMLEEYGIPVVSADELSRMVVAPGSEGLADVVEAFGPEVLDERGQLDRKKLGRMVFATPERRRQLESLLHPRIRERYEQVLDALEKAGHPVMVYEVPLLFEKKLDQQRDEMQAVILVTASADTRIARVKARDALTTEDVLARMRAQMPEDQKRQRANYIVHNDGNLDDLRREVEQLITRFLRIPPRETATVVPSDPEIEAELDALTPIAIIDPPTRELGRVADAPASSGAGEASGPTSNPAANPTSNPTSNPTPSPVAAASSGPAAGTPAATDALAPAPAPQERSGPTPTLTPTPTPRERSGPVPAPPPAVGPPRAKAPSVGTPATAGAAIPPPPVPEPGASAGVKPRPSLRVEPRERAVRPRAATVPQISVPPTEREASPEPSEARDTPRESEASEESGP